MQPNRHFNSPELRQAGDVLRSALSPQKGFNAATYGLNIARTANQVQDVRDKQFAAGLEQNVADALSGLQAGNLQEKLPGISQAFVAAGRDPRPLSALQLVAPDDEATRRMLALGSGGGGGFNANTALTAGHQGQLISGAQAHATSLNNADNATIARNAQVAAAAQTEAARLRAAGTVQAAREAAQIEADADKFIAANTPVMAGPGQSPYFVPGDQRFTGATQGVPGYVQLGANEKGVIPGRAGGLAQVFNNTDATRYTVDSETDRALAVAQEETRRALGQEFAKAVPQGPGTTVLFRDSSGNVVDTRRPQAYQLGAGDAVTEREADGSLSGLLANTAVAETNAAGNLAVQQSANAAELVRQGRAPITVDQNQGVIITDPAQAAALNVPVGERYYGPIQTGADESVHLDDGTVRQGPAIALPEANIEAQAARDVAGIQGDTDRDVAGIGASSDLAVENTRQLGETGRQGREIAADAAAQGRQLMHDAAQHADKLQNDYDIARAGNSAQGELEVLRQQSESARHAANLQTKLVIARESGTNDRDIAVLEAQAEAAMQAAGLTNERAMQGTQLEADAQAQRTDLGAQALRQGVDLQAQGNRQQAGFAAQAQRQTADLGAQAMRQEDAQAATATENAADRDFEAGENVLDRQTETDIAQMQEETKSNIARLKAEADAAVKEAEGVDVSDVTTLMGRYEANTKRFEKVQDGYNVLTAARKTPGSVGDVALIFGFMKMLDPESVVRESEQETARKTASIPDWTWNAYRLLMRDGKLTDTQRQRMVHQGLAQLEPHAQRYLRVEKQFKDVAAATNVDSNLFMIDTMDPEIRQQFSSGGSGTGPAPTDSEVVQDVERGPDGKLRLVQ